MLVSAAFASPVICESITCCENASELVAAFIFASLSAKGVHCSACAHCRVLASFGHNEIPARAFRIADLVDGLREVCGDCLHRGEVTTLDLATRVQYGERGVHCRSDNTLRRFFC